MTEKLKLIENTIEDVYIDDGLKGDFLLDTLVEKYLTLGGNITDIIIVILDKVKSTYVSNIFEKFDIKIINDKLLEKVLSIKNISEEHIYSALFKTEVKDYIKILSTCIFYKRYKIYDTIIVNVNDESKNNDSSELIKRLCFDEQYDRLEKAINIFDKSKVSGILSIVYELVCYDHRETYLKLLFDNFEIDDQHEIIRILKYILYENRDIAYLEIFIENKVVKHYLSGVDLIDIIKKAISRKCSFPKILLLIENFNIDIYNIIIGAGINVFKFYMYKIDIHYVDDNGNNLLMSYIKTNYKSILKKEPAETIDYLINNGLDINHINNQGKTILDIVILMEQDHWVDLSDMLINLYDRGARFNKIVLDDDKNDISFDRFKDYLYIFDETISARVRVSRAIYTIQSGFLKKIIEKNPGVIYELDDDGRTPLNEIFDKANCCSIIRSAGLLRVMMEYDIEFDIDRTASFLREVTNKKIFDSVFYKFLDFIIKSTEHNLLKLDGPIFKNLCEKYKTKENE